MPQETPSPLDLPEPDESGESALGWMSVVIGFTCVVLLLTNAVSLSDWIDDQPPSPIQAQAAAIADQWLAISRQIGLSAPRDALHAQWKRAEAARFVKDGVFIPDNGEAAAEDGGQSE